MNIPSVQDVDKTLVDLYRALDPDQGPVVLDVWLNVGPHDWNVQLVEPETKANWHKSCNFISSDDSISEMQYIASDLVWTIVKGMKEQAKEEEFDRRCSIHMDRQYDTSKKF